MLCRSDLATVQAELHGQQAQPYARPTAGVASWTAAGRRGGSTSCSTRPRTSCLSPDPGVPLRAPPVALPHAPRSVWLRGHHMPVRSGVSLAPQSQPDRCAAPNHTPTRAQLCLASWAAYASVFRGCPLINALAASLLLTDGLMVPGSSTRPHGRGLRSTVAPCGSPAPAHTPERASVHSVSRPHAIGGGRRRDGTPVVALMSGGSGARSPPPGA